MALLAAGAGQTLYAWYPWSVATCRAIKKSLMWWVPCGEQRHIWTDLHTWRSECNHDDQPWPLALMIMQALVDVVDSKFQAGSALVPHVIGRVRYQPWIFFSNFCTERCMTLLHGCAEKIASYTDHCFSTAVRSRHAYI